MILLDRYISRTCLTYIFLVMLAFIGISSIFSLIGELRNQSSSLNEALYFLLLTTPKRLYDLLVYSSFIGFLLALGFFAQSNQLTIIRAAGFSNMRLLASLVPSILVCLVISFLISEWLSPAGEAAAKREYQRIASDNLEGGAKEGFWLRDNDAFVQIGSVSSDQELNDVIQYHLDESNALIKTVSAQSARYDVNTQTWTLFAGHLTLLSSDQVRSEHFASLPWQTSISPRVVANQSFLAPKRMPLALIKYQIDYLTPQRRDTTAFELAFWGRLTQPLTYLAMAMLALAVVLGPLREAGMGQRLTIGIFIGLGFKYLQDLFAPTAVVFSIHPLLAVATPAVIYLAVAGYLLKRRA